MEGGRDKFIVEKTYKSIDNETKNSFESGVSEKKGDRNERFLQRVSAKDEDGGSLFFENEIRQWKRWR
ncbi:hypothetical protein Csa_007279 [Cucumis sativus]|uniref:Uncharacterized protein n=1 Tax=Cucumis sativus TaxID=3659 RepID=A0A0A0M084_CUCSA|nr:hypothetical protein Csa_007279 [Cucumis sativus]